MAYTSAPEKQTYSAERIPAAVGINVRPGEYTTAYDEGMKNLLPFKQYDSLVARSRYCIQAYKDTIVSGNAVMVRGMYVWEKTAGTIYYFVVTDDGTNSKVWTATSPSGTWTAVTTLPTSATTPVRFAEFITSAAAKSLILVDGVDGYVFTANTAGTSISDSDFPTPPVPFPVVIDGYLFLAKANTGDIYNSDLDNPTAWTAGSFISSELYPDDVQAIVKIDNYLLAIGTQGCEYFYDAANATASPLARYEGGSLPFGCTFPNTIAYSKNKVVFLANSNDGEVVFKEIEGLKSKDIPSDFIVRSINGYLNAISGTTTATKIIGFFFRQAGELFYAVNLNSNYNVTGTANTFPTYVFSFSTELWSEFDMYFVSTLTYPVNVTAPSTTTNTFTYVAGKNPITNAAYFGYLTQYNSVTGLSYDFQAYSYYVEIRTPELTFDTLNLKFMSRFGMNYLSSYIYTTLGLPIVTWTDDDWSTTTTRNMNVALAPSVYTFPFITQLGSFRRRRFKFQMQTYGAVEIRYFECDINKGQQ